MTRIVLFLTSIPLAAVLALALNTLLERRLAAVRLTRQSRLHGRRTHLWIAVLAVSLWVTPAFAEGPGRAEDRSCITASCALSIDSASVDALWDREPSGGVVLVAQSRIPVLLGAPGNDIPAIRKSFHADKRRERPLQVSVQPGAADGAGARRALIAG